jgi:hypothetical protein
MDNVVVVGPGAAGLAIQMPACLTKAQPPQRLYFIDANHNDAVDV